MSSETTSLRLFLWEVLGILPPGGWRVNVGNQSARGYCFDMVVREIRLKLRDGVPDNLLEMVIEQSSVDMPPSQPEYSIRQLRQLLA